MLGFIKLRKFFLKKPKGYILDIHIHYLLKIMACIEKEQNRENRGTNRGEKVNADSVQHPS